MCARGDYQVVDRSGYGSFHPPPSLLYLDFALEYIYLYTHARRHKRIYNIHPRFTYSLVSLLCIYAREASSSGPPEIRSSMCAQRESIELGRAAGARGRDTFSFILLGRSRGERIKRSLFTLKFAVIREKGERYRRARSR